MHALRSSTSAAATVEAPALATAGARTPPPVFPCRRRAGRRPRAVATAAPRGTPAKAQCTHCAARRRPPPPSRRPPWPPAALEHRPRFSRAVAAPRGTPAKAQCTHCAARRRPPPPSRRPAWPPPALEHRRRVSRAVAARAAAREPSRPSPRAEHPSRAQCTHCAARRRPPLPSRRPPWPPPALEHHHRFSRAVAAMGRPANSGARRPIAEHPARRAARAAHDHRWRPPPSRPPTPAPLRLPQRSRSSLRPRTVAPPTESAHRGRFPT
ncbi:hypothetical protein BLKGLAD_72220 (plasmid) [Burkholderia gladioli pv. gladioli]